MMELAYVQAGSHGQRREDHIDLSAAPGVELLYSCFAGSLTLRVPGADLSADFGWVPLLHIANNLDLMVQRLVVGETKLYHFTESEDWLSLTGSTDGIELKCSYATDATGVVDWIDARRVVRKAGLALIQKIEQGYPAIRSNEVFIDISARMSA